MLSDLTWSYTIIKTKYTINKIHVNHPETIPRHLWKNCLLRSWSLMPKRLGMAVLDCNGVFLPLCSFSWVGPLRGPRMAAPAPVIMCWWQHQEQRQQISMKLMKLKLQGPSLSKTPSRLRNVLKWPYTFVKFSEISICIIFQKEAASN